MGDGGPRFHVGKFEYREEIVGLSFRYKVLGYVDEYTRIVIFVITDGADADDPGDKVILCEHPRDVPVDSSCPAKGEEVSWLVTGYKCAKLFGKFTVHCKVADKWEGQM